MKDEILEHIRKHVTEWPEGNEYVYLKRDGEIVFEERPKSNFYPEENFTGVFVVEVGMDESSVSYTREQWQPENSLETIDKPFGKLDRKTQLRLVEHVLDGGRIEKEDPHWWEMQNFTQSLIFDHKFKYRAKPSRKDKIVRQIKALQDELSVLQTNP